MHDGLPGAPGRLRLLAQVVWNLRLLGLFLVGPMLGVGLVGATFGLASSFYRLAALMVLFTLSLFALLARGEWRRLRVEADRRRA